VRTARGKARQAAVRHRHERARPGLVPSDGRDLGRHQDQDPGAASGAGHGGGESLPQGRRKTDEEGRLTTAQASGRAGREGHDGRFAMNLRCFALVLLAGVAAACGGDPNRPATFSTNWTDDKGKSIAEALVRLRGAKPVPTADLVVSVAGNDKIIGTPL